VVARVNLDTEELMPPHSPLSEVTATARFFSTSAAARVVEGRQKAIFLF